MGEVIPAWCAAWPVRRWCPGRTVNTLRLLSCARGAGWLQGPGCDDHEAGRKGYHHHQRGQRVRRGRLSCGEWAPACPAPAPARAVARQNVAPRLPWLADWPTWLAGRGRPLWWAGPGCGHAVGDRAQLVAQVRDRASESTRVRQQSKRRRRRRRRRHHSRSPFALASC